MNKKISIAILFILLALYVASAQALEKLQNSTGTVINPATKESTDAINTTLQGGIAVTSVPSTTVTQGTSPWAVNGTVTSNQGGAPWDVTVSSGTVTANELRKMQDDGNTTTTPLGNGGIYTGTWLETNGWTQAIVTVVTDQNAATDGLRFEMSRNASTVDHVHVFTPLINTPNGHHYPVTLDGKYFRVKYTNGTTPQGTFKVITNLFTNAVEEGHVHPINYAIDSDHPAPINRSVIVGETTAGGGGYVNVKVNPSGALTADVTQGTSPWVVSDSTAQSSLSTISGNISTMLGNQTDGDQVVKGNQTPGDTVSNPTTAIPSESFTMAYNPAASVWRRLHSRQLGSDAIAGTTDESLETRANLIFFNGTTFDRARGDTTYGLDVDVTRYPGQVTYESTDQLRTVSGHKQTQSVHIDINGASGTVGYMLIDLSDIVNWKHTLTGHVIIEKIDVCINPSNSFVGDIYLGFLTNVDATDGDFNTIHVVHKQQMSADNQFSIDFRNIGLNMKTTDWFGPTLANDTTWQTDVNLYGPNGATSFPSGNGDFVMKLVSTAGTIDIGVTVIYTTGI